MIFTDFCVPSLNVAVQVMVTLPSALFLACNSESLSAFPSKSAVASAEEILQSSSVILTVNCFSGVSFAFTVKKR